MLEQRIEYKREDAENVREICKDNIFNDGLLAYDELIEAYTRLTDFLKQKQKEKNSFTVNKFLILADETFYGGISLIRKAAGLYKAIRDMHEGKLENELDHWEREMKSRKRSDPQEQEILKTKIANHRKRVDLLKKRKTSMVELMDQVEVLEATLDSTYLEVLDLMESDMGSSGDKLVSGLERAVKTARKVENRLRQRNGNDPDDLYLDRE